jgi:uncharacterized membrane protein
MMQMGRPGLGMGVILVAAVLMTGVFGIGGSFGGAIPASAGSIQLGILAVVVVGIAVLVTNHVADRSSQSPFDSDGTADTEDALEALKRRYANGEIDETEFERKLEMLFETETVADAERRVETQSRSAEDRTQEEPSSDRDGNYRPPAERQPKRQRSRTRRGHCK